MANSAAAQKAKRLWVERNPDKRKKASLDWYYRNRDKILKQRDQIKERSKKLKRNFGISLEEYDHLLSAQDGRCAICGKEPNKMYTFAVDHNHETGEIRGLLCRNCNSGIGFLQDNVELLRKAMEYLGGE